MTSPPDSGDLRLRGLRRGRKITIRFNGRALTAYDGESVAAALTAAGEVVFRRTARRNAPRGLFCGMGVCYDCMVVIDGLPGRRACMTEVSDGMRVELQEGWGDASAGDPAVDPRAE